MKEQAFWKKSPAMRAAYMGLFLALAVIFGYVEAVLPNPMPIPGMKLGLANLAIVSILYIAGLWTTLAISVARVLILGFLFGNLYSIVYGLAGAAVSLVGMNLLKKTGAFSTIGVSAFGGVLHETAQVLVASVMVLGFPWRWYLPVLILAGLIAGSLIGTVNCLLIPRIFFILKIESSHAYGGQEGTEK